MLNFTVILHYVIILNFIFKVFLYINSMYTKYYILFVNDILFLYCKYLSLESNIKWINFYCYEV